MTSRQKIKDFDLLEKGLETREKDLKSHMDALIEKPEDVNPYTGYLARMKFEYLKMKYEISSNNLEKMRFELFTEQREEDNRKWMISTDKKNKEWYLKQKEEDSRSNFKRELLFLIIGGFIGIMAGSLPWFLKKLF